MFFLFESVNKRLTSAFHRIYNFFINFNKFNLILI